MVECTDQTRNGYISDAISFLPVIEGSAYSSMRKYRFAEQGTGRCDIDNNTKDNLGFTMANDR